MNQSNKETYDHSSSSNWLRHSYKPVRWSAVGSGCYYSFPVGTADYTADDEAVDCMAVGHRNPVEAAAAGSAEARRPDCLVACSDCMADFVWAEAVAS